MKNVNILYFIFMGLLAVSKSLTAQSLTNGEQTIRVDFDFSGRNLKEVSHQEYQSWVISHSNKLHKQFGDISVTLKGNFKSNWYKLGISAPYYNTLGCDGLVATDTLDLIVKGLKIGDHSLLTFHNILDKIELQTLQEFDIYLNNKLQKSLKPSNRALNKEAIETSYINFTVKNNNPVQFRFILRSNKPKGQTSNPHQLVINGFEIDTPDFKKQAKAPSPKTGDEHVIFDEKLTLKWKSSPDAIAHLLYFGLDQHSVSIAQEDSFEYKGKRYNNEFTVANLYSGKRCFWRVDEVHSGGQVTKGTVWWFKPAQLAFPGAEGYGRYAIGGRGGKVIAVTNLNDDGPGSFRDAVNQDIGPRTIVFHVSGNIQLHSRLVINQPYITIAGQTAPGSGITISNAPVGLTGNNGVVRFLKVRIGSGKTYDGMGLTGANHSIIDHCSISWTIDESFSSRGAQNITLQRTLISEALNVAGHDKYKLGNMHGYAATIGGDIGSFHHNLLAHNYGRNWSMGGGLNAEGYYSGRLDIRNNVVYNWGNRTTDGGANEVNFVNNYYKPGAATKTFVALTADHEGVGKGSQRYFFKGNVMKGYFDETNQNDGRKSRVRNNEVVAYETFVDQPFFPSYVTTQTAKGAYKNVLSDVGSNQPVDDPHDQRIINETLAGTFSFKGSKTNLPGIIDSETDAGGFPAYSVDRRHTDWDTDHDGLPNWWELAHNLNPNSEAQDFSDANLDEDKDGYTNLEDYLNWMAQPHFFISNKGFLTVPLNDYFKGYQKKPKYKCVEIINGKTDIKNDLLQFYPKTKGFSSFIVRVIDKDGDSMTRQFNVFVN